MTQKRFYTKKLIITAGIVIYALSSSAFARNIGNLSFTKRVASLSRPSNDIPLQIETRYLVGGTKQVPVTDKDGNPVLDEKGKPVYKTVDTTAGEEWKQSGQDIMNLDDNLKAAGINTTKAAATAGSKGIAVVQTAANLVNGDVNTAQAGQAIGDTNKQVENVQNIAKDDDKMKAINAGATGKTVDQTEELLSQTSKDLGGNGKAAVYDKDKINPENMDMKNSEGGTDYKYGKGFRENDPSKTSENQITYVDVNASKGTDITNGVEIVRTMAHEQEHANGGNEAMSQIVGDAAARQMAIENFFGGYTTGGTQADRDNYVVLNSQALDRGSSLANGVEYGDAYREKLNDGTYYYKQQIPGSPGKYREGVTTLKEGFYIDPAPNGLDSKQTITFKNDNPSGQNPDQKVTLDQAEAIEKAAINTGFILNVNSTIGGNHSQTSAHYSSPGQAVDINSINGVKVKEDTGNNPNTLQSEFSKNPKITENFGPTKKEIKKNGVTIPTPKVGGHTDHIHAGTKPK